MTPANDNIAADILKGADEIAEFLGEDVRAIFYAIGKGRIPHFRVGQNIRARKSTLTAWIAGQESGARASA
ncbi:helix-turn-helix domain-containing protein [Shinella sp.]|uniref:helix-turn-helix domain-containing protein n=1 Tax=Shinella sp. TaxID=1870904 RepID=UPI0029B93837|nr:helix-turn-helix domain-containing protein [Shinella sp.]MDX3976711.1 helix-turn-helix domain-containing protein [Shinella sp.]